MTAAADKYLQKHPSFQFSFVLCIIFFPGQGFVQNHQVHSHQTEARKKTLLCASNGTGKSFSQQSRKLAIVQNIKTFLQWNEGPCQSHKKSFHSHMNTINTYCTSSSLFFSILLLAKMCQQLCLFIPFHQRQIFVKFYTNNSSIFSQHVCKPIPHSAGASVEV